MTTEVKTSIPKIGQPWPEQGGIYVGSRLINGAVHHVVIADGGTQYDIEKQDANAAHGVQFGEINGHSDWHAGDQEDMMLAYINAPEHFEKNYYWSRSSHHGLAWAFDFEFGNCLNIILRSYKFRVRPFRHFVLND